MAAVANKTKILFLTRQQPNPVLASLLTHRRTKFTVSHQDDHDNLAAFRRGRGGRSSFSGIVATVFGCSGFLGRAVVNRLGAIGSQVICPYRGDGYFYRELKLAGDLGQIQFVEFDAKDIESVRKCIKYSNVVINLMGKQTETKNFTHDYLDGVFPGILAEECMRAGVERLIHISHLAASRNRPGIILSEGSRYLRAKQKGENRVMQKCDYATVMRPSCIHGTNDDFVKHYLHWERRPQLKQIALWRHGLNTYKAPVYVGDLAAGIVAAVQDPSTKGKVYECYGPRLYTLNGICDYIKREMREGRDAFDTRWTGKGAIKGIKAINDLKNIRFGEMGWKAYYDLMKRPYPGRIYDLRFQPRVLGRAFINPYFKKHPRLCLQRLETEHHSDIITGGPSLEDLGVQLTPFEYPTHVQIRTQRKIKFKEDELMEDLAEPGPEVIQHLNKQPTDPHWEDPADWVHYDEWIHKWEIRAY